MKQKLYYVYTILKNTIAYLHIIYIPANAAYAINQVLNEQRTGKPLLGTGHC